MQGTCGNHSSLAYKVVFALYGNFKVFALPHRNCDFPFCQQDQGGRHRKTSFMQKSLPGDFCAEGEVEPTFVFGVGSLNASSLLLLCLTDPFFVLLASNDIPAPLFSPGLFLKTDSESGGCPEGLVRAWCRPPILC